MPAKRTLAERAKWDNSIMNLWELTRAGVTVRIELIPLGGGYEIRGPMDSKRVVRGSLAAAKRAAVATVQRAIQKASRAWEVPNV